MPEALRPTRRFLAVAPWIGVPFLLYLLLLRRFWFNAPAWDDYDAILHSIIVLQDADSMGEWLRLLTNQHNEHRIAFARLAAWMMFKLTGQVDFRALVVFANLAWPGILMLAWLELRDRVPPILFAGAALLLLQMSYYEASLLSMAGLSNMGALFFSLACLSAAYREGAIWLVACIVLGILAAGCQASGLLALPVAAAGCVVFARRRRAAILVVIAAALWAAYFSGYIRPPHHPPLTASLGHPLETGALFLINMGSVVPGRWLPILAGIAVLALLAWQLRIRLWKVSPVIDSWIVLLVLSIAAATVGRVGFGVFHSSRYAIYGSCLLMLCFLLAATRVEGWTRRRAASAIAACAGASLVMTILSWSAASEYAAHARLLVKAIPASPDVRVDPYLGVLYPNPVRPVSILEEAEKRGLWHAREMRIPATAVRIASGPPPQAAPAGYVDRMDLDGPRLKLLGWSHLPATAPGRTLVLSGAGVPERWSLVLKDRLDVATNTHIPVLAYSGFQLDLEYRSADEAKRAAAGLCVSTEAPGEPPGRLSGSPGCGA